MSEPPADLAEHAHEFAERWADRLDQYCTLRMEDLGVPSEMNGAPDFNRGGKWRAFDAHGRLGGTITSGIVVDSGVFNTRLLTGKGRRTWARARLRDRIDAIVAHEIEEARHGTHDAAVRAAANTSLPISTGARRILRAVARRGR